MRNLICKVYVSTDIFINIIVKTLKRFFETLSFSNFKTIQVSYVQTNYSLAYPCKRVRPSRKFSTNVRFVKSGCIRILAKILIVSNSQGLISFIVAALIFFENIIPERCCCKL